MTYAIVFPGQGTQAPQMGLRWRDHPSWQIIERAEKALGEPLTPLLTDEDADFSRTRNAQLAVLLTSLIAWDAARAQLPQPIAFAGHSLGQVTALIAAGTFTLEDGVQFAAKRAETTQQVADHNPGSMAALLGAQMHHVNALCNEFPVFLANDNAPGQLVIAGPPDAIANACARAPELGIKRAVPLEVGGAFHTPLMIEAANELRSFLDTAEFQTPSAPVISNLDAQPYKDEDWQERLSSHVARPVRWNATMQTIADLGATQMIEIGHGTMISGLARRAVPNISVINIATPQDLTKLEHV